MEKQDLINQNIDKKSKSTHARFIQELTDNNTLKYFNTFFEIFHDHKRTTLLNKFIDFYCGVNMSSKEWDEFNSKLSNSKIIKSGVGEFIIDNIDKLNYDKNLDILSKLVKNVSTDVLTPEDFFRLTIVLQRTPYVDLELLKEYDHQEGIYLNQNTDILLSSGLIYNSVIGHNMLYKLNNLGALMLKHGF